MSKVLRVGVLRTLAILLPLSVGVLVAILLVEDKKQAPRSGSQERVRKMRYIELEATDLVPRASGYGTAQADKTWRAIARVGGYIAEAHPGLRAGARLEAGAVVLRLDTTDLEISIAASRAEVERLEAELTRLELEEENLRASLEIAEETLRVAARELERIQELVRRNASSAAESESSERAHLAQRASVQELENGIRLMPSRRRSLEAQLDGAQSVLDQAKRDLELSEIRAPFSGTIGPVALDVGQFITPQESLFELFADDRIRVDAAVSQEEVERLLDAEAREAIRMAGETGSPIEGVFDATVVVSDGGRERIWEADVVGVRESLDANTRALLLTVTVDKSPLDLVKREGLPLTRGAFCRVDLRGRSRRAIVLPRSAVSGGSILTIDNEERLGRRPVDVKYTLGNLAVLASGLEAGDRVIVSTARAAIDGTRVIPVRDEALMALLKREAAGGQRE
ncbi:MAG: efflux RND transporter periplasmic adaptor subunit [Planctomycetota bacterium]